MKYASKIVGLPILSHETGQKFDQVIDLVFDQEANRVLALLTDHSGLIAGAHVIRFEDIQSIGDDAVIVPSAATEIKASEDQTLAEAVKRATTVKNKTVMTDSGQDLGKVSDVEIDELTGRVLNYQASGGIFADLYNGRPVIPAPMTTKIGEDVVFVPDATADLMQSQSGGLKAAGHTVADKAGDLKDQAVSKTQQVAGSVQDSASGLKDKATSPETKTAAAGFLDNVKQKAADIKDQASQKVEDTRINSVLGKPASRVVMDKQDKVILNTGDIITHQAVEQARAAGELEVLLNSAYTKGPQLSTEDMKAKEPGPGEGSAAAHV